MNARDAINFVKSPTGTFIAFCLVVVTALVLVVGFKKPQQAQAAPSTPPQNSGQTQVVQTVRRDMTPLNLPRPDTNSVNPTSATAKPTEEGKSERLPISLFAESPSVVPEPKPLGKLYAPYGRLIPCELIVTIDSARIRTPIIGLITEDIYHAGRLVIPAGTEVHGTAQTDRTRERIASGIRWTLVWQNGDELTLNGLALDREQNLDGEGWGITDGSAGLRGRLVKSDSLAEIKLFAATFLSGAASALTDREQTLFGSIASPSLQNAPLKGAQEVLNVYAQQILETIQRDGFYVRVPAGKQFYLYVTQTIDKGDAVIGGTRLEPAETNAPVNTAVVPVFHPVPPQPSFVEP